MTDLRQAAQQALEALKSVQDRRPNDETNAAITALRTAMEQPEQTKLTDDADTLTIVYQRGRAIEGAHGIKENTFEGNSCSSATPSTPHPPQQQAEPVGEEWTACMKLPIVVHVRQQRPGEEHVSTREGITPVKPDDLIMRGVSGEEYPIGRAIFEQTYSLDIAPPQQQAEPVAYYHPRNGFYWAKPTSIFAPTVVDVPPIPLYTTAAQRPWVGLTDEDWEQIHDKKGTSLDTFAQGAVWAQARLMERNK